jgi:hypothetical protein
MRISANVLFKIFSLVFLLSAGCQKKEDLNIALPDWTPTEAVPFVNSNMTLRDFVDTKEVNILEDPNGLYTFVYKDTMESPSAEDIIKIPNQSHNFAIGFNSTDIINNTPFTTGKTITKTTSTNFSVNLNYGANLKYIDLKGGVLPISFSSDFKHQMSLTLTFASLKKNGVPLVKTYSLNYAGTSPVTISDNIILDGYRIDLSNGGTATNRFDYSVSYTITSNGNVISVADQVRINLALQSLKYSLLYGDIGQFPISPYNGSLSIDVFDRTIIGDIFFEDPKLKVTFDNSFGVPVSFSINKLEAVTTDDQVIPITHTGSMNTDLNFPGNTEIGQSATTEIILDKGNSNIQDVLNPAPNKINYSVQTTIGASGSVDRFVTDKSKIKVYVDVEIPLDGRIKVYGLQDTVTVDMPESEYVEKATLKLKTTNKFPVDIKLQIYFLDSDNTVLDSLISPNEYIATSGQLDANGKVASPSIKYTEIVFDKNRYDKIDGAKRIIIRGGLATTNNATVSVKFYSFYTFTTQISLLTDLKVKLK